MKAVYVAMMAAAGIVMAGQVHADEALAKAKNCLSCHAIDKKLVGPAYKDVAAKYKGDKNAPACSRQTEATAPKLARSTAGTTIRPTPA